jgi:large subunit ribosomal protein L9
MNVILREDFPSLGYVGDTVGVRRGYARNFLIPRGIAIEASPHNEALAKHRLQGVLAKRNRLKGLALDLARKISNEKFEFVLKVGEKGKSFGSISSKEIEAELKTRGYQVERKQIRTNEAIRRAGEYKIFVKLHSEVTAEAIVTVQQEAVKVKPVEIDGEEAPKKRRSRSKKKESAEDAATDSTVANSAVAAEAKTE